MAIKPSKSPRYKRTLIKPLYLQHRDLEIIQLVYDFRLINSKQLKLLIPGSDQVITRRLQKLFHQNYLDRIKGPVYEPIIYGLGNKGADILAQEHGIERGKIDWVKKNQELKERYLSHTLQITNFRATLTLALKGRLETKILSWLSEGELKDEVIIQEKGQRKIRAPLIPDAFFTLEDDGDEIYFFLEADQSTMSNQRFLLKMRAYWNYWKEKKHKEKLGIEDFRVLIITKSEQRKENLRAVTKQADDRKIGSEMFWFTSEENYNLKAPETILKPIWQTPRNEDWHHLLE